MSDRGARNLPSFRLLGRSGQVCSQRPTDKTGQHERKVQVSGSSFHSPCTQQRIPQELNRWVDYRKPDSERSLREQKQKVSPERMFARDMANERVKKKKGKKRNRGQRSKYKSKSSTRGRSNG
ncbi:hypothetical protein ASPZODRAFT_1284649 [Penicilliopsis zonata CBS 506.65]|uniref:Uncharacterized protein n=1 Tax=Penicilliopsis zonata CBS 506.65 TaxID=1073090 RepID=A0A1L9S497_9EURO|nr:hypothetical protein ASPZODRAFT_1284649 [Penicilliopsis zonata CBS 506.65]OJJ41967.1 hypothetical protein ASPZODRAFT_1284649 [Penicilliopsis zonata CBS 506.65]